MKNVKIIYLCISLLFACTEPITIEKVAQIVAIEAKNNSSLCTYKLSPVVPYAPAGVEELIDVCNKYTVGQVIRF